MVGDDILPLLSQAGVQPLLAGLGDPGGNARYGQGRILSWNEATFENQVAYRGGVISNMPVLSGPDALTYQPGDIVAVMSWAPNRGATVYWIMGRVIIPGPGRGQDAIEWMTGQLGRALAVSVFSDRIKSDEVFPSESGATGVFGDLATFGPQVTEVEVSESGKLLVFVACTFAPPASGFASGHMSFEVVGPETRAAQVATAVSVGYNAVNDGDLFIAMTKHESVSGLTPGIYTVTAKYAAFDTNAADVVFTNRELMTIAL